MLDGFYILIGLAGFAVLWAITKVANGSKEDAYGLCAFRNCRAVSLLVI